MLEADGAVGKLGVLLPLLTQIDAALGVRRSTPRCSEQVRRTEREFLLREQLKAIQRELGEEDPAARERQAGRAAGSRRAARRGADASPCASWSTWPA